MNDVLSASAVVLRNAGFTVVEANVGERPVLVFEDATVIGFVLGYELAAELLEHWTADADELIKKHQFALRRAGPKAWNVYTVVLSRGDADFAEGVRLAAIEEDLTATRKIARAAITDGGSVRAALLPLLPVQSAPELGPVDIPQEIRSRATELPSRAIDAFLSAADLAVVLQVLEESHEA